MWPGIVAEALHKNSFILMKTQIHIGMQRIASSRENIRKRFMSYRQKITTATFSPLRHLVTAFTPWTSFRNFYARQACKWTLVDGSRHWQMGIPDPFGLEKQVAVLSCMIVYVDTYCVLKCTSGRIKKPLLHLAHSARLKVIEVNV